MVVVVWVWCCGVFLGFFKFFLKDAYPFKKAFFKGFLSFFEAFC